MRQRIAAIVVTALMSVTALGISAGPAAAGNAVCVGQLGSFVKGGMASVTAQWRDDFLGLSQPAGFYAVHIAHTRTECP